MKRLLVAALLLGRLRQIEPSAGGPKVAFLLSTLQEERYQKDKATSRTAAKKLGLAPFTLAADNDNARQLAQVEDALARGAKVLVIQPTDAAAAGAYVSKAHEHGARSSPTTAHIKNGAVDYYVAHDSFKVGVLQAEAAVKATGGKGNYVLLDGQSGHSVATEIARGYYSVLQPLIDAGDVHIVVEKNHDAWSPEQALKTVEDAIAKTKGDIAGHPRQQQRHGARRGAGGAGSRPRKNVFIAGADADAANVDYVCEGKQSIEVLKDIQPLAEKAAEVAAELARTGMVDRRRQDPVAAVAVSLVDRANARALVIDSGFHTAAELPSCK